MRGPDISVPWAPSYSPSLSGKGVEGRCRCLACSWLTLPPRDVARGRQGCPGHLDSNLFGDITSCKSTGSLGQLSFSSPQRVPFHAYPGQESTSIESSPALKVGAALSFEGHYIHDGQGRFKGWRWFDAEIFLKSSLGTVFFSKYDAKVSDRHGNTCQLHLNWQMGHTRESCHVHGRCWDAKPGRRARLLS
jgi:hypothetical protein